MKTHCTNADHLRSFQIWIPGTAAKRLWVRIDGVRNPCVWIFFIVTWVHFQPLKVLQSTLPLSWSAHTHMYIYIVYIYMYTFAQAYLDSLSIYLTVSINLSILSQVLSYLTSSCLVLSICARARLHVCLHPRNILNLYSVCELYDHHPLLEEDVSKCQIHYIHAYTETYIYM